MKNSSSSAFHHEFRQLRSERQSCFGISGVEEDQKALLCLEGNAPSFLPVAAVDCLTGVDLTRSAEGGLTSEGDAAQLETGSVAL